MIINQEHTARCVCIAAILIVFSSSLFYNRIEGILALTILVYILLVGYKRVVLGLDRSVIELFLINVSFALSVLLTAFPILGRKLTSTESGIEYFLSIIGSSILGCILYSAYMSFRLKKYLPIILVVWGVLLSVYCVWYLNEYGGRVHDVVGRYVHDVGFPYTLFVLAYLSTYPSNSKHRLYISAFLIFSSFFVTFYGIQSRALTIALMLALSTLALRFFVRVQLRQIVYLFLSVVIVSTLFVYLASSDRNERYIAIWELLSNTVSDLGSLTSNSESDPSNDDLKNEIFVVGDRIDTSSANELLRLSEAIDEGSEHIEDVSLQLRYKMLIIGVKYSLQSVLFGHGNASEKALLNEYIGKGHPHLHNQYLSFLVSGGIIHLIFGLLFSFGCMVVLVKNAAHTKIMQILPIIIFMAFLLLVGSHNQLLGFQNLYIYYSFILLGIFNSKHEKAV